jgi:chromosome segregation ATPase
MDIWEAIKDYGLPIVTGVAGWWAGKPKVKAEIDTTNVDNAKKLYDEYKELVEIQKSHNLEKENTIAELRGVISMLEETIGKLNDTIEELKEDNHSCKKALKAITEERNKLQQEVEKLKTLLEGKYEEDIDTINDNLHLN